MKLSNNEIEVLIAVLATATPPTDLNSSIVYSALVSRLNNANGRVYRDGLVIPGPAASPAAATATVAAAKTS